MVTVNTIENNENEDTYDYNYDAYYYENDNAQEDCSEISQFIREVPLNIKCNLNEGRGIKMP